MALPLHFLTTSTLLFLLLTLPTNHHPTTAAAYPLFPWAKFHVDVYNNFTNEDYYLTLNCSKITDGVVVGYLDPVTVNHHGHWRYSFRKNFIPFRYMCDYTCPREKFGMFDLWMDDPYFIDHYCGGRHFFWVTNDDGFYLFNLKDKKYHKWSKI